MNWNLLYFFLHLLFASGLCWSLFQDKSLKCFISTPLKRTMILGNIFIFCMISLIPIQNPLFPSLLFYFPLLLNLAIRYFIILTWRERWGEHIEFFLNSLIAQIKVGSGFRQAFKQASSTIQNAPIQNCFLEVFESILLKKPLRQELNFSPIKQTLAELQSVDKSSRALEHLEHLRWQVRTRSQFNKKVKTALMQVRVQSFILLLLYLGLFGFSLSRYGLKYPKVLFGSLFLFCSGLFILLRIGKKIRWNI